MVMFFRITGTILFLLLILMIVRFMQVQREFADDPEGTYLRSKRFRTRTAYPFIAVLFVYLIARLAYRISQNFG